ncbi:MAG: TrkA family potassium uptake protein [Solirubrobacteraceae bacterium]|nr:TrkA family potassium uptake protein [Solirubrobacteraceae bacterium]
MFMVIAGGGKVGLNLARELLEKGHELSLIEQWRPRYIRLERELEHVAQYGDATELWVLERAGIARADMVIAVTGDDEDNILICQVAKQKYGVERIIARCNNPRNLEHFKLLGIEPAVSATDLILNLIEHSLPGHGLVRLLDLSGDQLEIIEVEVHSGAPADGKCVGEVELPQGSRIISLLPRDAVGFVPTDESRVRAGDEVLVILDPGLEDAVMSQFTIDRRK